MAQYPIFMNDLSIIKTKIIAHRGDREHCPENTMASFNAAVEKGVDVIELDVHMSRDDKLIVHHDYYLGSTNNGEGLIFQKDSGYIKSLDAGSWFSKDFVNQSVPFLEEVFETINDKVAYEIELKGYTTEFLEATLALVRKYNLLNHVEFTSPHPYILSRLKEIIPTAKIGCFVQEYPSWMTNELGQAITKGNAILGYVDVVHCPLAILSGAFIRDLQKNNIKVHTGNCDTEVDIKKALALRVNQLSTNKLDLALDIRNAYKKAYPL